MTFPSEHAEPSAVATPVVEFRGVEKTFNPGTREHIYLVLAVIVAIAFLTDKLWAAAERRLFPYRVEK